MNRLKLIKRMMYGRAKFDLLRLRVLYRAKRSQHNQNKKTEEGLPQPRAKERGRGANSSDHHPTSFAISEVA